MSDERAPGIEASDVRGHLSPHRTNDAWVALGQRGHRGQRALSQRSSRLMDGFMQNLGGRHVAHEVDFNKKTVIDSNDDTDRGTVEDDIFVSPQDFSFNDITEGDYSEDLEDTMSEHIHTMSPGAVDILKAWANASEVERAVVMRRLGVVSMATMEREVTHAFAMAMRDAVGEGRRALNDKKAADIAELQEKVASLERDKKELEFSLSQAQEISAGRAMAAQRIQDSGAQKTDSTPEVAAEPDSPAGDVVKDADVPAGEGESEAPETEVETPSEAELTAGFGDDDDSDVAFEAGNVKEEALPEVDVEDEILDQVPEDEPENEHGPDIPDEAESAIDDDD